MQNQAEQITRGGSIPYGDDCIGGAAYTATMTFGERVRDLRIDRGWSQAELGRRAHMHGQTINNIEHGRNKGGWKSRKKLAEVFGIPLAEFDGQPLRKGDPNVVTPFASLTAASDKDLLDWIALIVRELERRGHPPDSPTPPTSPTKPTPRPRRHR